MPLSRARFAPLLILLITSAGSLPRVARADASCPAAILDAAKRAVPAATVSRCTARKPSGFEVTLQKSDKSIVELDLSDQGAIEQIEEVVPLSAVPAPVVKAVAARYPKATMRKAEKQTKADHSVTFEILLVLERGRKEATFKADGTFVEEE